MNILHKLAKNRILIMTICVSILVCVIRVSLYNHNYERICRKINSSNEETFIEGIIAGFPEKDNGKTSFCVKAESSDIEVLVGEKLWVSVKDFDGEIHKGDTVRFISKLYTAEKATNEGAFDYKNYLKSIDVVSVCYPEKGSVAITRNESVLREIYDIRSEFTENCRKYIYKSGAGLVSAVLTGDRSGIDDATGNNLKYAGIYHIVAISGLHLNLFIMAVCDIIKRSGMSRKKKAVWSLVSCVAIGLFVMFFTGFGISVIRAYVMMLILFSASLLPRESDSKNSLFVTGFSVTALMPYTIYSVSWWLSFLSTLGVIDGVRFAAKAKNAVKIPSVFSNYVTDTFIVSAFTALYTLPVTSHVFGYLPVYAWLANTLVLPVMSIFMCVGVVFAFSAAFLPAFFTVCLGFALTAMGEYISFVAKLVSSLPYAATDTYYDTVFRVFIFGLCACGIMKMLYRKKYVYAVSFLLAFTVAVGAFLVYNGHDSKMKITFADAGQGDCSLVEINGYDIMIDCGSQARTGYSVSPQESLLRAKNIRKLDAVFITHYHTDHTNGAVSLLEKGKAKLLILPRYYNFMETEATENREKLLAAAVKNNVDIRYVAKGSKIPLGKNASLEILSPSDNMFFGNNDMSLVTKINYGNTKALIPGDADVKAIERLMDEDLECDILKLAHHGGYCDMSEALIKKANPSYAVASCGENNIYGHPDSRVVDILKEIGCTVYRTDKNGAITVTADKNKKLSITLKR